MEMICDKERYERFFKGFTVYDCAVGYDNTRYCFILVEATDSPHRDPLPRTRFLFARMERPMERRFYFQEADYFDFTRVAYAELDGQSEFVAVDMERHVFRYDAPAANVEQDIPPQIPDSEYWWSPTKVTRIAGRSVVAGTARQLRIRHGADDWRPFPASPPVPERLAKEGKGILETGFEDVAGFAEDDVYAVGGAGDVWHFNGKAWRQIDFPSNELLYTVCCAGDGNVYISGNGGSLWVGRNDRWKRLLEGGFSLPFKDSAWFAGRLWCGSDNGLWVLQDGKLINPPDQPAAVRNASGVIDVSPDGKVMLTASPHGAAIYDGKTWTLLFSAFAFAEKSPRAEARQQLGRGQERLTDNDDMQALLDVIGNDGPDAALAALGQPETLDLAALRAHSWLLLVNAISAQGAWDGYDAVARRLIELGADADAADPETGMTARAIAQAMNVSLA
ncbi:hypothetical protein [Chitiniphilus eburneus]|uniref:hypothetical protein n=1 Tax=Chitiniphilus eburneus TaxID=2571148 RepID=UPI001B7FE277|nr:hypothetical protein [Chitiniphilus eburneus]